MSVYVGIDVHRSTGQIRHGIGAERAACETGGNGERVRCECARDQAADWAA
jgi:hypothetical protein